MIYIEQVSSLALQNKYTKWYCSIMSRAQARTTNRKAAKNLLGYVEKHHILPRSFNIGGEKDKLNYAYLTAKEHFICHKLLASMFTGVYKSKMIKAYRALAILTASNQQRYKINSREFDRLRKLGGFAGEKHSSESKELMRINADGFKKGYTPWNKGTCYTEEHRANHAAGLEKFRKKNPNWADQCREARKIGESKRLEACSKITEVDGVIYPSATDAAEKLGLKKITLIKRVKSLNFPTYKYLSAA